LCFAGMSRFPSHFSLLPLSAILLPYPSYISVLLSSPRLSSFSRELSLPLLPFSIPSLSVSPPLLSLCSTALFLSLTSNPLALLEDALSHFHSHFHSSRFARGCSSLGQLADNRWTPTTLPPISRLDKSTVFPCNRRGTMPLLTLPSSRTSSPRTRR
jgi:hypothetical protein